jgi:S-formylglutathione hydrolase
LIQQADERLPILIDQGGADGFLTEQLQPELLLKAATAADYPVTLRIQAGYDHSYFFVASFIAEHVAFHAAHLNA